MKPSLSGPVGSRVSFGDRSRLRDEKRGLTSSSSGSKLVSRARPGSAYRPASRTWVPAFFAFCAFTPGLLAEDGPSQVSPPPIQQQLDALKEGQERMFQELEQIKALLQERTGKVSVAPAVPPPEKKLTLNLRGEPFRGASTAKVVIVEYSDFACPHCAKYTRELYPRIDDLYVRPGKVKYFFRDLPTPEHTNALAAACAARCAGEQGKFWEMHDLLFAAQPAFAPADLISYAAGLGLDTNLFSQCLASSKYEQVIRRVVASAERMGLYGTPVFLIGVMREEDAVFQTTKVLVGASEWEAMQAAVDEALTASPK